MKFFNFNEAVTAAKNEIDVEFIGLRYVAPFTRLDIYVISVDPEEPNEVNIQFEAGDLFDEVGEEDFYNLADVPDEAKALFYARNSDLGSGDLYVLGMTSEFVLQAVLPNLSETKKYASKAAFIETASAHFLSFWRH